jgi:hypothetical protein
LPSKRWKPHQHARCRHLLCLLRRFATRSRQERPYREVSPLSRGVMSLFQLNAYPGHYNPAFAFSQLFYSPPYRLALRFAFPRGKDDELTTFRLFIYGWVRCLPVRRWLSVERVGRGEPEQPATYLLVKPISHFGLSRVTTFIGNSHVLPIPSCPSAETAVGWQLLLGLTAWWLLFRVRLHCPQSYRKPETVASAPRLSRRPAVECGVRLLLQPDI